MSSITPAQRSFSGSNFLPALSPYQLKLREAQREAAKKSAEEAFGSCVALDQVCVWNAIRLLLLFFMKGLLID